MSQLSRFLISSGPGSGTVKSIIFNGGLTSTPDPVTTTGTATIDQTNLTVLDGTVYWDTGTQLLNTTATGTAGEVLTSQGAGLPPIYMAAPGTTLTFDADSGSATPAANVINFLGGSNITSAAAGSTVSYRLSGTTNHTVQLGNSTGSLNSLTNGTTGQILTAQTGADPIWTAPATSGTVTSVSGGNNITITGTATINPTVNVSGTTTHAVQIGNATGSLTSLAVGTTGQVLTGVTGSDPVFASPAASAITITGDSGGALGPSNAFTFTGGTTGLTFSGSVTTETLSGTLAIANGGTDATSFAHTDGVIYYDGTRLIATSAGTTGQVLTGVTSGAPVFASPAASSISITGNTGGALTGNAFTFSGGTTGLSFGGSGTTETLSGTLAVANGGTNATSFATTDGVVYYDGTRLVTTAVGSATQVLTSNGAGVAPTFQAAASGGITTINGDSGSVTGSTVSIKGNGVSGSGQTVLFSGSGTAMSFNVTDANGNTTIGKTVGKAAMSGQQNAGIGFQSLGALTTGSNNYALGYNCLNLCTSGAGNIGIGSGAGNGTVLTNFSTYIGYSAGSSVDGANNTMIGFFAAPSLLTGTHNVILTSYEGGINWTGSESNNITIGEAPGTAGDNHILTIGNGTGTGTGQLNKAFISGITGITVTGTAVLVSSGNQLGIAVSSKKYKENIEDLGDVSSSILDLRPVSFNYTVGDDHSQQTGLIAEEVHEIMPSLVAFDKDGEVQAVKYHDLPVLILNELKKSLKRIEILEEKLNVK
jgi:hypothetical protein